MLLVVLHVVANEQPGFGVILQHYEQAAKCSQCCGRGEYIDKLQRFFKFHSFRHVQYHSILAHQGVESHGRVGERGERAVMLLDYVGVKNGVFA